MLLGAQEANALLRTDDTGKAYKIPERNLMIYIRIESNINIIFVNQTHQLIYGNPK